MKLGPTAREAPTPLDLDAEDAAFRAGRALGEHSTSDTGRAQGISMIFGKGRLVVLGEAALFSAQIVRTGLAGQQQEMEIGMNVAGTDDRQFALNVLHWLSKLL